MHQLPPDLAALASAVERPIEGFFGPKSMSWHIAKERVLFLGGPRALLLQLAHPHVAQGVADHSAFLTDPLGRSFRTFSTVFRIVFGSVDEAIDASAATRRIHAKVKGELPEDAGQFKAHSHFHANRGDLLFWVHATLVESAIYIYDRYVARLGPEERDRYYQEAKLFARLFGAQERDMPPTYRDFTAYFDDMVNQHLAVSSTARELCQALMWGPPLFRPLAPGNFLLAGGMLPRHIRDDYGLPWNFAMEAGYQQITRNVRRLVPHLPPQVRELTPYRQAVRRISGRPSTLSRVPIVGSALKLPF